MEKKCTFLPKWSETLNVMEKLWPLNEKANKHLTDSF